MQAIRAALTMALAPALLLASQVPTGISGVAAGKPAATWIRPQYSNIDCNSPYGALRRLKPSFAQLCADPVRVTGGGYSRFADNGYYVGHDEPQVRFISHAPGSGNDMTYFMRLPAEPARRPTPAGTVTDSAELAVPWFGLVLCDPLSYPQQPCTPDSDRNLGGHQRTAAGSALLELQFYPPGFPSFLAGLSCSARWWCAALTIDSLSCTFNMVHCNPNCTEIVNFAFLQTNGVPTGSPSPQGTSITTLIPNAHTLRMRQGDVLRVSISDPRRGLTTRITDLTTGQAGYMVASAANGFTDTRIGDCSGRPWTYHAEYNTARRQNMLPWLAGESAVAMTQEIGHFHSCDSVIHPVAGFGHSAQTCVGGVEGRGKVGPGPCTQIFRGRCKNPETEGVHGPVACPTKRRSLTARCEFTGFPCAPKGTAHFTINGHKIIQIVPVSYCEPADLDFDSEGYLRRSWPDGHAAHPTPLAIIGPFTHRLPYPVVQFETDVGSFERLCHVPAGNGCQAPPLGASFYPYWSLNRTQRLPGLRLPFSPCIWNFGQAIRGFTIESLGRDRQYGRPDVGRFAGTLISKPRRNPAVTGTCSRPRRSPYPGLSVRLAQRKSNTRRPSTAPSRSARMTH